MSTHVTLSSKKHNYRTPAKILDLAGLMGSIGLDPATDQGNPVGATHFFTLPVDGLTQDWQGYGLVFVNPPYGRGLKKWTAKMALEASRGVEILALIPARVGTQWWRQNITKTADTICCWTGRLNFLELQNIEDALVWAPTRSKKTGKPTPAAFDSALVYWGPNRDKFHEIFGGHGWIP